jgi:hypothetical protein
MKDTTGGVSDALRRNAIVHEGNKRVITADTDTVFQLQQVDEVMREVADRKSRPFYSGTSGDRLIPFATGLGKRLISAMKYDLLEMHCLYPKARFSPYFALFERLAEPRRARLQWFDASSFKDWQELVQAIREGVGNSEFAAKRRAHERGPRENHGGLLRYVKTMQSLNSKLLGIRIDVGYKLEHTQQMSFADVQRDREALVEYINASCDGNHIGHAWKIEHGQTRYFHMHFWIFYNGHKVQQDVTIAKMIGDHWVREITRGKGYYHNCNAHKEEYKYRGIGKLPQGDPNVEAGIRFVVAYMTKPDYHIRLVAPPGARTFGRTSYPKNTPLRLKAARLRREAAAERARAIEESNAVLKHAKKLFEQLRTFSPTRKVVFPRHPRRRRSPA